MRRIFTLLFLSCSFVVFANKQIRNIVSECSNITYVEPFDTVSRFGEFNTFNIIGGNVWEISKNYSCAYINGYTTGTNEDWLVSSSFDLTNKASAVITFDNANAFGTVDLYATTCKLKISADYVDDVKTATWTELEISFSSAKWGWTKNTITIPESFLGESNVTIAFHYNVTEGSVPGWEIKNFSLNAVCKQESTDLVLPVALPNIGEPDLVVFGQNLRNYFVHYTETDRVDCGTYECFVEKTSKVIDVFQFTNADIFALCELEANDTTLKVLTDSLNGRTEDAPYAYIVDGIFDNNYSYVKSGFIYRKDKVQPIGQSKAASSQAYYENTMRLQMFEDLTTGGRFTLSMNHFKAKDNTDDAGEAKRLQNASDLIASLAIALKKDTDVLILGDLNCYVTEKPLQNIINAGYEEQLLRYDASSYSYCYGGVENLIDHALASCSMAKQITGAAVYHICTSCGASSVYNSDYRYSDHDPYIVGLKLNAEPEEEEVCDFSYSETFNQTLGEFQAYDMKGGNDWYIKDNSYAYINGYSTGANDDWLVSPSFDLSNKLSANIAFSHANAYGSSSLWKTHCKLKISSDFKTDVQSATWEDIEIPFGSGNWNFRNVSVKVPAKYLGKENVSLAFHYNVTSTNDAPAWEVKNFVFTSSCEEESSDIEYVISTLQNIVFSVDKKIVIKPVLPTEVTIYTMLGRAVVSKMIEGETCLEVKQSGVYLVKVGVEVYKVVVK